MTGTMTLDGLQVATPAVAVPVWGIDSSTLRVSVGIREGVDCLPYTLSLPGRKGFQGDTSREAWWHAEMLRLLVPWFKGLAGWTVTGRGEAGGVVGHYARRPAKVRLEEPFGGSDKPGKKGGKIIKARPSSHRAFGVVLAALGLAIPDIEVDFVGPTTWKARSMGSGHGFASKPEIMAWARSAFGYVGGLQDEADAIGIAESLAVDRAR